MYSANMNAFVYRASVDIPQTAAARVWQAWEKLSQWQEWDASLKGTKAPSDGLEFGKHFAVLPRKVAMQIPVTVVACSRGQHFTTCSAGPLGLLAFGHTLIPSAKAATVTLEHAVCAVPSDPAAFAAGPWEAFKRDVDESVKALAALVSEEVTA